MGALRILTSSAKETTVRVAVVQAGAVPFDTEACVDKAVRLIGEAAATGAKVIVFPEAFVAGYPKGLDYGLVVGARDRGRARGVPALPRGRDRRARPADAAARRGRRGARRYVVIGVIERDGGTCYCTVLFFGPDGRCSASTAS